MFKIIIVLYLTICGASAYALELNNDLRSFAANMESCYGVPENKVTEWLMGAQFDALALSRMDRQTESRSWGYYKPLFVTENKSIGGYEFYLDNSETLQKVEKQFGVNRYVITAILGVETDYGRFGLKHRAIDTLTTLAFNYPRRAAFFSNELKKLFLLSHEEDTDPSLYLSSYAGAVGLPQFMPSNIGRYGVDFDGDGKIDIVSSKQDAIASIAKYLKSHGFKNDRKIAVQAEVAGEAWREYANKGMKPRFAVEKLLESGVIPYSDIPSETKASLYELKLSEDKSEYWLFLDNFYAITRYNPSVSYALAVTLLAFEIQRLDESFAE